MAASSTSLIEGLGQVPELEGLEDKFLRLIEERLQPVVVPEAGTVLAEEDTPQSLLFFVLSGKVERTKRGVFLDVIPGPRMCGLLHAFRAEPTFATLRASAPTQVFSLSSEVFRELVSGNQAIAMHLLQKLAVRVRTESKWTRAKQHSDRRGLRVVAFDSKSYDKQSFEQVLESLNAQAPSEDDKISFEWLPQRLAPETASAAINADAICIFVNDQCSAATVEMLSKQGVRLILLRCAGYDGVDLKACLAYGIPVLRVPAYSPEAVAEHAVALMLTLTRQIHRATARTREGNFSLQGLTGIDIHGKTIGVIGTGRIGKCFVNIAKGFGGRVIVSDVYQDLPWATATGVSYVPLDELLQTSDIISIHCPLLDSTRHMINEASLAKMKDGVILLNTSRGALIDTAALIQALQSGKVGFAGLDVYEHERPYFFQDRSSEVMTDAMLARLASMQNVILTGHQAYLTNNALRAIAEVTLGNVAEFFWKKQEQPLTNQVLDEWNKAKTAATSSKL